MNVMDEILSLNSDYFSSQKDEDISLISVEKIIKKLQKHKIVKVIGLHHSQKTATVYEAVKRMGETRNCFYFNSQIYKNSRIGTAKGIVKLIDYAADKKAFDSTSILVFESIEDIKNAKDVISELYQKGKYRIILIGSLKHLHGLPSAKVLPPSIFKRIEKRKVVDCLETYMSLGALHSFEYEKLTQEQKAIRNMMTDSCIFHDVIMSHGVKDIFLYQSALSFIARNIGRYLSLRDITKLINEGNLNTSVITMTDYMQCSISAGFIHKLKRYDLKKEKKMDSKGSYYFGDLGILASIKKDSPTMKYRLFENLLLLELLQANFEVHTGMNGKFLFSFYTKKLGETKCIHISHQTDKKEIKKEINKLTKIEGKSERYLVVENFEDLGLRKKDYQTVQLVSYIDILEIITK